MDSIIELSYTNNNSIEFSSNSERNFLQENMIDFMIIIVLLTQQSKQQKTLIIRLKQHICPQEHMTTNGLSWMSLIYHSSMIT